ncbi:MAG: endo-1,4-beta-xylanase [Steroidobacter sp.]
MLPYVVQLQIALCLALFVAIPTSLILLCWKRKRKLGVRILIICFLVGTALLTFIFYPHTFKKSYRSNSRDLQMIALRAHADAAHFYLGAAVDDLKTLSNSRFLATFNSITPENALKMRQLVSNAQVDVYDFAKADAMVNFALQQGLRVRGHTLVWGKLSDLFRDPDLEVYLHGFPVEDRAAALQRLIELYVKTVVGHFRGRIVTWDVVNEPLSIFHPGQLEHNVYWRYLGPGYIRTAFMQAHKADPDAKLYLNEELSNFSGKRAEALINLVNQLKRAGVPIDGVGLQSHFIYALPSLAGFQSYLERLAKSGVTVEITELDARLALFRSADDPYIAQGQFYSSLLHSCLQNLACKGMTFWGFTDKHCWLDSLPLLFPKPNEPYLFDAELYAKPALRNLDLELTNCAHSLMCRHR